MTTGAWLLVLAAVVLLLLAWAAWTLTRLRRLQARADRAWTALDTQLQRRAGLAEELARDHAAALGPGAAARLAAAAAGARAPQAGDRELAENALGRELRDLPADLAVPAALRADLAGTGARLQLARRFYNDAVRDTRELRRRRLTRLMRVHARRPLPRFFDIDDAPAAGIGGTAPADRGAQRP
ncbi:hypothetical protein [Geodermatophilus sp. URMC 64]